MLRRTNTRLWPLDPSSTATNTSSTVVVFPCETYLNGTIYCGVSTHTSLAVDPSSTATNTSSTVVVFLRETYLNGTLLLQADSSSFTKPTLLLLSLPLHCFSTKTQLVILFVILCKNPSSPCPILNTRSSLDMLAMSLKMFLIYLTTSLTSLYPLIL